MLISVVTTDASNIKVDMENSLSTIGRVSKQTDVNIETIRYYEKVGLLKVPLRSQGGNRLYNEDSISRLNFIKRSRELGFSLDEIRELVKLSSDKKEDCHSAQKIADLHLKEIELKIKDLKQLAHVLANLSSQCSSTKSEVCPILNSLKGKL